MANVVDLSHPITGEAPCSFSLVDSRPKLSFEEGESQGISFITSRLNNLHSNTGTHIDFPGHLPGLGDLSFPSVGEYPVDRFIGKVLILDVSSKLAAIMPFFAESGELQIEPNDGASFLALLQKLEHLEINRSELEERLKLCGSHLDSLRGIIFYCGLSRFWRNRKFYSWEYLYFFNPFLSKDACELVVSNGLSFIGIDALQPEHPIINFGGDEHPLVLNLECREYWYNRLKKIEPFTNHQALLGNDILIYENLKIPQDIANREVEFSGVPLNLHLRGLNDNALVRPYAVL